MTEASTPRRRRRTEPVEALRPGVYFVGRFGDQHDVLANEWLTDVADADLAAAEGYLAHGLRVATAELERRQDSPPQLVRVADLRDTEPFTKPVDSALAELAAKLNVPASIAQAAYDSAWPGKVQPLSPEVAAKVEQALADPVAYVAKAAAQPEVLEETLGTRPVPAEGDANEEPAVVGGRPVMPWDDDATGDDPWQNVPAS